MASIVAVLVLLVLQACSTTRHVPDGELLLDKVKIKTDNKAVSPDIL